MTATIKPTAQVADSAVLGGGVFVSPALVLTNDTYPRAVDPDGHLLRAGDWEPVGVDVAEGASLGAIGVRPGPKDRLGRAGRRPAGRAARRGLALPADRPAVRRVAR